MSVYCEFCRVEILGEPVKMVNGLPFHQYHTPDKTAKPELNSKQLEKLAKKLVQ